MSILINGINVKEIKRGAIAIINIDDVAYFIHSDDITVIPDHGDLIDRDVAADDACLSWCRNSSGDDAVQEIIEHLRKMEAVIPAERNESPCDDCDYRSDAGCSLCRRFERSEE